MNNGVRWCLLLICILALGSCSLPGGCDVDGYRTAIKPLVDEYSDAFDTAGQTSRIALPGVISQLQDIRRRTEATEVSPCLTEAHSYLVASMDDTIEAFLLFMGQGEEEDVNEKIVLAQRNLEIYDMKLKAVIDK